MNKTQPQPGQAPPAYSQAAYPQAAYPQTVYNTQANYGVQPAPPYGGSVPPPPPPGMITTTTSGPTVMVSSNAIVVGTQPRRIFTKFPTNVVCQYCNSTVVTQPRAEVGCTTWAIAGIMILFGFWLGCCLIPFCIDDCKDIYHDCPNCHKTIDVYKHM